MTEATVTKPLSYGSSLAGLLFDPRRFFAELAGGRPLAGALAFSVIGACVCAAAGLLAGKPSSPVLMGTIVFINAMGMMLIGTCLCYMAMVMLVGKQATFGTLVRIYAYAFGVTLLFSWVSQFLWFTEAWKWWLIYTGLKYTCNVTGRQAVLILVLAFAVQSLFLTSATMTFVR